MTQPASQELIHSLRKPTVIFTDDFLNDVIKTKVDERFQIEPLLQQVAGITTVKRDPARFAQVDIGVSGSIIYPVLMTSPIYVREEIATHIDRNFREF